MTAVMSGFLLLLLLGGNREFYFYFLDPAMVRYRLPGWNTLDSLDYLRFLTYTTIWRTAQRDTFVLLPASLLHVFEILSYE